MSISEAHHRQIPLIGFLKAEVEINGEYPSTDVSIALTDTSMSTGARSETGPNLRNRQEKDMPSWMMNQAEATQVWP
jgi:hypothetical protein